MADFNIPDIPMPIIDQYGLTLPMLNDIHGWLRGVFQSIYGTDIYIEDDSQDGQLIGVLAKSKHDYVSVINAVYQSFSPTTAQGIGLSRVVKINGIRRNASSRSQADLRIVGVPGTLIENGVAEDVIGQQWALPTPVTIPLTAEMIVRAICTEDGSKEAPAHTITNMKSSVKGWQTVDNPEPAIVGMPVETDAQLRVRQSLSTEIPSRSLLEGMIGAVASITGVFRYKGYENEDFGENIDGMPAHSFTMVVDGGDPVDIASVIRLKKAPGVVTYGTTSQIVLDEIGIPHTIRFSRSRDVPIRVIIPVRAKGGYTTTVDSKLRTTVADWVNNLHPGDDVELAQLITKATLDNNPAFSVERPVTIGRLIGGTQAEEDLVVAFDEHASLTPDNVIVTRVV